MVSNGTRMSGCTARFDRNGIRLENVVAMRFILARRAIGSGMDCARTMKLWKVVYVAGAVTAAGVIARSVRYGHSADFDRTVTMAIQRRKGKRFARLMWLASWAGFPPQSRTLPFVLPGPFRAGRAAARGDLPTCRLGNQRNLLRGQERDAPSPPIRRRIHYLQGQYRRHEFPERPRHQLHRGLRHPRGDPVAPPEIGGPAQIGRRSSWGSRLRWLVRAESTSGTIGSPMS